MKARNWFNFMAMTSKQINIRTYMNVINRSETLILIYWTGVHLSILIILCVVRLIWCDNNLNPDWEEPDAFSKRKMVSSGKPSQQNGVNQPECPDCLNDNLSLLYKKLAKFLLNRKNMKVTMPIKLIFLCSSKKQERNDWVSLL